MKLIKTVGLIAAGFGLVALMGGEAFAQNPLAPVLTASASGNSVTINWTAVAGATSYTIQAGSSSGSSNIAEINLPPSVQASGIRVTAPNGTYFLRVRGNLNTIPGPFSNEVSVTAGGPPPPPPGPCVPPGAPTATAAVVGPSVTVSWNAVAGATGYQVVFSRFPGGSELVKVATGLSQTEYVPVLGTFFARVIANNACGNASSAEISFTISSLVNPNAPRTPNPPPGQLLPAPSYGQAVVQQIAAQYRGDLNNSCREHGGNNIWLFRLLAALRQRDSRWGLNDKRGNAGDMSQDIITYNPTDRPDVGESQIYLFDTISGHCGDRPDWNWADVTQATWGARGSPACGTTWCARWTIDAYLRAGFPAVGGQP